MTGFFDFTPYQAEALVICLAASLLWAGVLLACARRIERTGRMTSAEKLWAGALLFAVMPSLVAPSLAAFGVSLRPAAEPVAIETFAPIARVAFPTVDVAAPAAAPMLTEGQMIGGAALLYVYGVALAFLLWGARQLGLHYAVARAVPVGDAALLRRLDEWADRLDVRRPSIRRSRHVSSVCIFGVVRQTILIPDGIESRVGREDLVLMCAHELAHVRRGDTRLFTATQLARVLFWFNPLVARIAANAELAAEEEADALVLAKGVDRRRYAACFVEGLKFAAARMSAVPVSAPSFTPRDANGRRRRLNSILSPEEAPKAKLSTRLMLSAAASALALVAVGQAALAVDPESKKERALKDLPLLEDEDIVRVEAVQVAKNVHAAKIVADQDGVVVEAADRPKTGKTVVIDHGHGRITRYTELDSVEVKKGARVKAGDTIARGDAVRVSVTAPEAPEAPEPPAPLEPLDPLTPFDVDVAPVEPVAPAEPAEPAAKPFSFSMVLPRMEMKGGERRWRWDQKKFAFAMPSFDHAPMDKMMDGMETRLEGALDGKALGDFNMTLSDDGEVWSFSSDEEMTDEERAEMRKALEKMRAHRDRVRAKAERHREEWREAARAAAEAEREAALAEAEAERAAALAEAEGEREAALAEAQAEREAAWAEAEAEREAARIEREAEAEAWRIEAEAEREAALAEAEAEREAARAEAEAEAEARAEARDDARMSRRDLLEAKREAIDDARADLDSEAEEAIDDAMADLDDAESDLDDPDISERERSEGLAAIAEARRQLDRDRAGRERAIEEARRRLDAHAIEIDRMIGRLDRGEE